MSDMSKAIRETMERHGGWHLTALSDQDLDEFVKILGAFYYDLKEEWERRYPREAM